MNNFEIQINFIQTCSNFCFIVIGLFAGERNIQHERRGQRRIVSDERLQLLENAFEFVARQGEQTKVRLLLTSRLQFDVRDRPMVVLVRQNQRNEISLEDDRRRVDVLWVEFEKDQMDTGHRNVNTDGWNVVGRRRVSLPLILDHGMRFVLCRWKS